MQVVHTPDDIYKITNALKTAAKSIGLVPTMGALHHGHLSLVEKSAAECDVTVVSIFVNPLQFNNSDDLEKYPRDLDRDLDLLSSTGVDYVFIPTPDMVYERPPVVQISFGELANVMEGEFRPGHFSGVGVVVSKLFHYTNPARAYFGLKDLQQYLLIKAMVRDLSFPVEVIGMPIIREASGLAMSSRNARLSDNGKLIASEIYKGLEQASKSWLNGSDLVETKKAVNVFYRQVKGLEIEYFEIVDPETLRESSKSNKKPVAFCVAGYVEGVRLIDNLYLR